MKIGWHDVRWRRAVNRNVKGLLQRPPDSRKFFSMVRVAKDVADDASAKGVFLTEAAGVPPADDSCVILELQKEVEKLRSVQGSADNDDSEEANGMLILDHAQHQLHR